VRKPVFPLLVVLLLMLSAGQGVLAAVAEIPTEVPLTARDDEAEQKALEAALVQALETLTHNEQIGASGAAKRLKRSLRDYLLEYEFVESGDETIGWLLKARFDRDALAAALAREQGDTASLVRDEVLFWLVYGHGDEPGRILGRLGDEKLVRRVETAAAASGIRAVLPLYDLEDRRIVSAADIVNGYVEGIEKATGRYHVDQYITGEMRYRDKLWHVRLEQFGVVTIGESKNAARALRLALAQLRADTAAVSVRAGAGRALRIAVAAVRSYGDYRRLTRYLERMPEVAKVTPAGNSGDSALFTIDLKGSEAAWLARLRDDGMLAPDGGAGDDDMRRFRLLASESGRQ